ncbi:MAG TPA: nucleotidyltransferase domain-containing protein [Candidatus Cloacimonetes bacterium]|nr:nucleotidyltransferase domain-containing protein [Candidatus Cloacimonadota bacterium]
MYNTKAMSELKTLLKKSFPEFIEKIILFGSQIEGTSNKYSDYDILLILKKKYDWKFKNKVYDKSWEIDFKYDILTDISLISKNELNSIKGKLPFIVNALENGVEL